MTSESPTHPDAPRARRRTLKVWPEYFAALESGEKAFEFRKDDRDPPYAVGDRLILREWRPDPASEFTKWNDAPGLYTGRECLRRVTYVARGGLIPEGYCVMSIVPWPPDAPRAGGETPTAVEALAERATYTIERLRAVSESVNAGHDRYIPNDADDAADLIAELRASLLERHRDGERLDWLERAVPSREFRDFCNGLSTPWPGTFREFVDAAMSAGPSPERASK